MPQYVVDRGSDFEHNPAVRQTEAEDRRQQQPREVPRGVLMRLQLELRESIRARTSSQHGERSTLRKAFNNIDTDRSGMLSIEEFSRALERFGLHTADYGLKGGAGGVSSEVVKALFDSFDSE